MKNSEKELTCVEYNLEPAVKAYYGYDIIGNFFDILSQYKYDKIFFISDKFIYELYGKTFVENLAANDVICEKLLIEGTEKEKTFKNVD